MENPIDWHSRMANAFDGRYHGSVGFRERLAVWGRLIERYVGPNSKVLDAGCGPGILAQLAAVRAANLFGFDGSERMVEMARRRAAEAGLQNVSFEVGLMGDPAVVANRRFNVILCSSVFEYVEDWWTAFDVLAATLEPSGLFLFSMPNGNSAYRLVERAVFRLSGRPAYYGLVHHVPQAGAIESGLSARGYKVRSIDYYAKAPLISRIARPLGLARLTDTLFVVTCQRTGESSPKSGNASQKTLQNR